jgi:hypothetical protein
MKQSRKPRKTVRMKRNLRALVPGDEEGKDDGKERKLNECDKEESEIDMHGVYTELKAGYRLTIAIESWEKDMDSPFTRVEEGCTKKQLEFLVTLCRLFRYHYASVCVFRRVCWFVELKKLALKPTFEMSKVSLQTYK